MGCTGDSQTAIGVSLDCYDQAVEWHATFVGDDVGNVIYTAGVFELPTVQLLNKLLDRDTVFFDIGAHIGQYTLIAAPLCREVHCFEPMPWIYEVLDSNIRRNKLNNVSANRVGIRDYTGSAEIWEGPKDNSGSGSFLRIPGFYEHAYSVQCVTLDQYCDAKLLPIQPGKLLIKIDVERAELEVLRGARALFDKYEPVVILEFNDWSEDLEALVRFFDQRGYTLHVIWSQDFKHSLFPRCFPNGGDQKPSTYWLSLGEDVTGSF